MESRRKVLVITYYFPPSGGVGVQRVLKFVKYLPSFGWDPIVLTVPEDADFPVRDPGLAAEIPDEAQVFRSGITEFYDVYRRLTGKSKDVSLDIQTVQRADSSWKDALARKVRGSLFIPDGRIGWYRPGVAMGKRILRELDPDAIFATGPPFTAHWIGRTLSSESGKPLVLDFRDPWTRSLFYPARPSWARRLDERLEARCVRSADHVLTVNEAIRADLQERIAHDDTSGAEFHVIPNGFDPADFSSIPEGTIRPKSLAHVGSVFASRVPWTFLETFEKWVTARPDRASARLTFAGRLAPEMEQRLSSEQIVSYVERLGLLSHERSLMTMRDAGLLLLLTGSGEEHRGMVTGKVYEYLGSGTPILALVPEGEAEDLIRGTNAGLCVRPEDHDGICGVLDQWWDHATRGLRLPFLGRGIDRFSRSAQAQELARLLDRASLGAGQA